MGMEMREVIALHVTDDVQRISEERNNVRDEHC